MACIKILGICGLAISPFMIIGEKNSDALDKTIEDLDSRPTKIFRSVSQCYDDGYHTEACKKSQENAIDIAGSLGSNLSYSSQSTCIANHQLCNESTTTVRTTVNNTIISSDITTYSPNMIAWQTAADDISISVPLYQASENGLAVRKDGAAFEIK